MLSLDPLPFDSIHWATRFKELSAHAQTVADIAQALEQERGNNLESELRAWAEAFKACVESHRRDVKILSPWARLGSEDAIWLTKEFRDHATEWLAIERSLRSTPLLGEAPDKFDAALSAVSVLRATWENRIPTDPGQYSSRCVGRDFE